MRSIQDALLLALVSILVAGALPACSSCGGCGGGDSPSAEIAKLLPAYSVGTLTLKNVGELANDVGMQQLVAVGGPDAQRGVAAMTGMLGFDPSNPATMATAGLDPNAPIVLAVTRLQGEATTPVLFLRTTDPAVATNYLMQKAPLAGIQISGQVPVGSHTVYTGTGEAALAATFFDKVLVLAFGAPQGSQPMGAIQELVGVEGGQVPPLGGDATYNAAISAMGSSDLAAYVNVGSLNQGLAGLGLDAEQMRAAGELRRFSAVSAALDIQANVIAMKYFVVPAAGGFPQRIFSADTTDLQVLDRIGGQPLFATRSTVDLPTVWAQMSPQMPELNEARQELLRETGLNLDTDVIGMLSGTFSLEVFRVGEPPAGLDIVLTMGLTDPMKINRILQVLAAKGLQPTATPVGGTYVNTWAIEGLNTSMAVIGNQAVIGIGRDAAGLGRIVMGQDGPPFRSQIRDPAIAQRFGQGGNGAMFLSLAPLMQQVGAMQPDTQQYAPAFGMVDTIGGYYEQAGGGYLGAFDLHLVQGQTVANWFVTMARIEATRPQTPPPFPGYPPSPTAPPVFPPPTAPQQPVPTQ